MNNLKAELKRKFPMINLIELFQSFDPIAETNNEDCISATPIPGYQLHRLGKDALGRPLLLISIFDVKDQKQQDPIELEHLTVMYDMNCRISHSDNTIEEKRFTVVRCTGEDPILQSYFLKVASTIIISLSNRPIRSDVSHAVHQLIELFRAMEDAPLKSVQGLWAEMFLISQACQPAILIDAWHTVPEDRYDFAKDNQRIEVKSFSGDIRLHYFSLEQLHPPGGVIALVASVCVEGSQAGDSIADLREKIQSHLGNNLDTLLHIDRVIARTLGNAWQQVSKVRFDERIAAESLTFYETSSIPSVTANLPPGVSQVRFRSDLTEVDPAENSLLHELGGIFEAALR